MQRVERNIIAGCLVVTPVLITYWIISTVLQGLVSLGRPLVAALAGSVRPQAPDLADLLVSNEFEWILAALLTLVTLYALGALTTRMIGRRLLAAVDRLIGKIPFVQIFYGATRKLVATFENAPIGEQRVVLIEFPSAQMKALGFVTRIFKAADTGQEVAAVYVPTTPVPTSGFMEIVPVERLIWLDWTPQEGMQFIVSGGTLAPDMLHFTHRRPATREQAAAEPLVD